MYYLCVNPNFPKTPQYLLRAVATSCMLNVKRNNYNYIRDNFNLCAN